MEEQASQPRERKSRGKNAGRSLDRQRRRAEELLAAQKARLEKIESDIGTQLDVLCQAVAAETDPTAKFAGDELRQQAQDLNRQAEEQNRAQLELAENERRWTEQLRAAEEQLREQQDQLRQRQAAIEAAEAKLRQAQRDATLATEQRAAEIEQLARREGGCAELELRLRREQDQLELQREQTKTQRRRIAQELKAERASQQRELDRLRHDVELYQAGQRQSFEQAAKQLQHERADFDEKLARQRDEIRRQQIELEQKETDLQESHRQLAARERQFAQERSDEADGLRQEIERLKQASAAAQAAALAAETELSAMQQSHAALHKDYEDLLQADERLQQSHEELRQNHASVEQTLASLMASYDEVLDRHGQQTQAYDQLRQDHDHMLAASRRVEQTRADQSTTNAVDQSELNELRADREAIIARLADAESKLAKADLVRNDELQRRFELAIEDVRSLKRRNSELEEQVLGLKSSGPRPSTSVNLDSPNWEATKRRMLESLEADPDKSEQRSDDRVTIENTILITDDVVAGKDREIAELQLLLSQQASNLGTVAVGAAAVATAIDQDELVRQERAKLVQLQEDWKTKLRQAEIDISVERAKITRDRAEIEEKLATYENERARHGADPGPTGAAAEAAKKPVRGRWLARLGLKDGD